MPCLALGAELFTVVLRVLYQCAKCIPGGTKVENATCLGKKYVKNLLKALMAASVFL